MGFRKKIVFIQVFLFLIFVALIFILSRKTAQHVVFNTLRRNSDTLLEALKEQPNQEKLVTLLEDINQLVLYGVSLFTGDGHVLFDSTLGPFAEEKYLPIYPQLKMDFSNVLNQEAIYSVDISPVTHEKILSITIPFESHLQLYILQTSFAFAQVDALALDFEIWYIVFCVLAFVFFGILTALFFHRINYPIQQIIRAVRPYQLGKSDVVAKIVLASSIDEEDQFYKLAQTLNSLSERVQAQIRLITEERNEKEAILESLGEGVIAVDEDLTVRYINFVGSKMLGIPRRHLIGRPFPLEFAKATLPLLEKSRQLLTTCQDNQTILADSLAIGEGKKVYIDLIAAPKGGRNGAIIVLQDKSSHYRVLEMGKDFVANASHELRTPITIIKGFAETLQDLQDIPHDMLVDITEKIVRNCQRMDSLVKNLLTLADLDNLPASRFHEFDMYGLVENCSQVVRAVYTDAVITIQKKTDSVNAFVDPDILELAIINLLDNACKYSSRPAQINVVLSQHEEETTIMISDRGIGIPEQDLEHVFDRFYTVNKAHSRRLGGAGLGLSIVKTIIEKHDGTIEVTSKLGQGTTFTIELPSHQLFRSH